MKGSALALAGGLLWGASAMAGDSIVAAAGPADYPAMWLEPTNCGVHSTDPAAKALLASLAALSNNAYLSREQEEACRKEPAGTPSRGCRGFLPAAQWEIVGGNGEDSPTGLGYRIYSRTPAQGRPELVFAIRGTQFLSGRDWVNNLYLKTDRPPPQQREAAAGIHAWIEQHRPQWKLKTGEGMEGEDVYAVGHSLGGAVAQYLAYTLPRTTAIVFNPSPRTGYTAIASDSVRNPAVCQIRESYEGVYVVAGGYVPMVEPKRHACGFVNQKRFRPPALLSLVSAHRMRGLAQALDCYAQDGALSDRCRATVENKAEATEGRICPVKEQ